MNWIILVILLCSFGCPCSSEEYPVILTRKYGKSALYETFKIYEGSISSGVLRFSSPRENVTGTYQYVVCLPVNDYIIHMQSTLGNGWESPSTLSISINLMYLKDFHLTHGSDGYATFTLKDHILPGALWKYSDTEQSTTAWTTGPCTWPATNQFPLVTKMTRYFRYTMYAPININFVRITVVTTTGFRFYVGGQILYSYNLPAGNLKPVTPALSESFSIVDRTYSTLMSRLRTIGHKLDFAVEVHFHNLVKETKDAFECYVYFDSENQENLIHLGGRSSTNQMTENNVNLVFDNDLSTSWSIPIASYPVSIIWNSGSKRQSVMNAYQLYSSHYQYGLCQKWIISGSDDGEMWYGLDYRENVEWHLNELKQFQIPNSIAFHRYQFTCLQSNATSFTLSELTFFLNQSDYHPPAIKYPSSMYTLVYNQNHNDFCPLVTGFYNWTIIGTQGEQLPTGLTLNSLTGCLIGVPTTYLLTTEYSISAYYYEDNLKRSTTLHLTVLQRDFPDYLTVTFTKINCDNSHEFWHLRDLQHHILLSSSTSLRSQTICLQTTDYELVLRSSSGLSWNPSSLLILTTIIENHVIILGKFRLIEHTEDIVPFSLTFPILPASYSSYLYYCGQAIPSLWYAQNYNDSSWPSFTESTRPSVNHHIYFLRHSFSISSLTHYHGFELHIKTDAGIICYLNNHEIYRRFINLPISMSSFPTGGSPLPRWRIITGLVSLLQTGNNTIAISIITSRLGRYYINFNMYMRLLKACNRFPSYWGYSSSTTTAATVSHLFDQDTSTAIHISKLHSHMCFTIQYINEGTRIINKYGIIPSEEASHEVDPSEWVIRGSNDGLTWTDLKHEYNVIFEMRGIEYIFYMPLNDIGYTYYQLEVLSSHGDMYDSIEFADWMLYLEDLNDVIIPSFAFTPSFLLGYTGTAFPSMICSSSYYTFFQITPSLPPGLSFNSNTGVIRGIATSSYSLTEYTITAINPLGQLVSTTIAIQITSCSSEFISFSIQLVTQYNSAFSSFTLYNQKTDMIIDSRSNFVDYSTLIIPYCTISSIFILSLEKTDLSGWGKNTISVLLADGTVLLTESLEPGLLSKNFTFSPAYTISPRWTEWHYKVDAGAVPTNWNTVENAPSTWPTALPGSFPLSSTITQYYYKLFTIDSLELYASLDIMIAVQAAAIIYLNGYEIRRIHLETEDITNLTMATREYPAVKHIITGETILNNIIHVGENSLAIEYHQFEISSQPLTFDASLILLLDSTKLLLTGFGMTQPNMEGNEGSDKVFDNNMNTKLVMNNKCNGVTISWKYLNERREPITAYTFVNGESCNIYSPSAWKLYGSNNDLIWELIQTKQNQQFTSYHQHLQFKVYNTVAYSSYKFVITECNNKEIDELNQCGPVTLQLTDIYLYTKRMESGFCEAVGDFPAVMEGDYSFISCSDLYHGYRFRICLNGTFTEEQNTCSPKRPSSVSYGNSNITAYKNEPIKSIVPIIVAADYNVTIKPDLPCGLDLDPTNGVIYGIPDCTSEMTKYTVTVTNVGGTNSAVFSLAVLRQSTNWSLIAVICGDIVITIIEGAIIWNLIKTRKANKLKKNLSPKTL